MNFAYRQDFGMGNPNVAGALLAVLVLAVFMFPCRNRWAVFEQVLAAAALFGCLLLTASRGAFLGLLFGAFGAWALAGFPKPPMRWLILAGCLVVVATALFGERNMKRLASLSPDEGSTASRIAVYRCIPPLLMAAPKGWGYGKASLAYENWFQDKNESTSFRNLLSTHGTWMVENGWLFSAVYILAWAFALLICAINPITFGMLLAWGFALSLSHVGYWRPMWVLPAFAVVLCLCQRCQQRCWPSRRVVGFVLCSVLALAAFVVFAGTQSGFPALHMTNRGLFLGEQPPKLVFLAPDARVLGKTYGKALRLLPPLHVATRWADIAEAPVLVLSGTAAIPHGGSLPAYTKLVWLNPPPVLDEQQSMLVRNAMEAHLFWGELRADASPHDLRLWAQTLPTVTWHTVRGRSLFLGDEVGIVTKL